MKIDSSCWFNNHAKIFQFEQIYQIVLLRAKFLLLKLLSSHSRGEGSYEWYQMIGFIFPCCWIIHYLKDLCPLKQCCGSMTFWGGSGSGYADPCLLWLMDLDPDPAVFVINLQDASKKLIFNTIFSAYYFLKLHLHHFSKIKSQKESQNSRNQGFSYYFCVLLEGSGSGRPKNMCIRWIRIRNTALKGQSHEILCFRFFSWTILPDFWSTKTLKCRKKSILSSSAYYSHVSPVLNTG